MIDGEIMQVEPENLVTEVLKLKHRDYGIVQICAAKAGDKMEVTYSFGKEYKMGGLRLVISPDTEWFTQIIPATGLGYIYFGSMFAPIFTVVFNILGLHFDYKLLNTSNLFVKYVLIYCSLWGGLSICFNTQIPFGNVVVYIFPLYLFYRLFSKLTIKLA